MQSCSMRALVRAEPPTPDFAIAAHPVRRSRQIKTRRRVSGRQLTTNRRSCQTIGDACPWPGMGTFHRTFVPDAPSQVTGTFVSILDPSPRGPRQLGQFSQRADEVRRPRKPTARIEARNIANNLSIRFFGLY